MWGLWDQCFSFFFFFLVFLGKPKNKKKKKSHGEKHKIFLGEKNWAKVSSI